MYAPTSPTVGLGAEKRTMNPEIDKVIDILESRIAELVSARDILVESFDPPDSLRRRMLDSRRASRGSPQPTVPGLLEVPASGVQLTVAGSANGHGKVSRKDLVAQFLRTHGPASRSEILTGTQIPKGTIAYVLNDKARFTSRRGKWHNVGE